MASPNSGNGLRSRGMSQADLAASSYPFLEQSAQGRPLCVDLDGTLVGTDTLWEGVVGMLRQRPWLALLVPFWMLSGRAGFKRKISSHISIDAAALPYREGLVNALRATRQAGRKVVLATAADRHVAQSVAAHVELFDEVFSSDGGENLKAERKKQRLIEAFGEGGFDYVGDSRADLPIFESAGQGFLINASPGVAARASRSKKVTVLSRRPSLAAAMFRELRVHQWAKNALVLLPLAASPRVPTPDTVARGLLAALAFSLCASAGYVINDLLDLSADRQHGTKKQRPFASGALPVVLGPPLLAVLLAVSFGISLGLLPLSFTLMLGLYFVGTMAYSLELKRKLLLDVVTLAGLYTHRILSGGIATAVPISAWLLGFSLFFFLSLAFAKRYVEILPLAVGGRIKNRAYYQVDLQNVASMGIASGYLAALVFTLYVENGTHPGAYREPRLLWLLVPVLLYWVSRVWILAGRGEMQDDPVRFALRDRISLMCAVMIGALAALARFTPSWLSGWLHS
ncbi:MAG: UbiA family prenyltransferase [Myxococcales bacterium]